MIEREVQVVALQGDKVWVEAQRINACSHCGASNSCSTSVLAKWMKNRSRFQFKNNLDLHVGDHAIVGVNEQDLVKASLIAYLFPLVFMIVTALLVSIYTNQQGLIAFSGLAGLLAGFFIVRRSITGRCSLVVLRKTTSINLVTSN